MSETTSRRAFLASGLAVPALRAQQRASTPAPALRYRTLGKTGLRVTELGFGSEAVSDTSVFARAIDVGINFFDTARPYQGGGNERMLAPAIKDKRKQLIVSSRSYTKDPRQLSAELDISLKELGVDYLDIYYMGQRDSPKEITPELVEVLRRAQKTGKIRFIGVSTHRPGLVVDAIIANRFDVVQTPYSFATATQRDPFKYDTNRPEAALDKLKQAGIGVVAMKVMAGGYPVPDMPNPNKDIHARTGALAAAIRWALRDDRVQTTSVRMTDRDQLEENLAAMSRPYNDADGKLLTAYLDRFGPKLCRMCGACDGSCPNGVHVADAVRSVMYAESYGAYNMGRNCWTRAAGHVRCSGCEACLVECPNKVNVRERLIRAEQFFA